MQPFDYRLAVQNPVAMALQGYMQGQQFQNQRVQAERDTQLYDMQMQQYQMQQQELARQQARAQEVQSVLAGVAGRIGTGEVTAEEIAQIGLQFPEISEQVNASFEKLSEAQKQGQIKELSRFAVALSRSPEAAMGLIDQRIAAAEEAGDVEQVDQLKAMKSMAEMDPTAPLTAVMLQLGTVMDPEQFKTFYEVAMPAPVEREVVTTDEGVFAVDLSAPDVMSGMQRLGAAPERSPLVQVGGEQGAFETAIGKSQAENIGLISTQGQTARRNRQTLTTLQSELAASPTGAEAAVKSVLGNFGIPSEGLSNIQAAEALINQLVPAQRPPGSGTMSDRDVALFKSSLPRLINTPEGNRKIIQTMIAMNDYLIREGELADAVIDDAITREQYREQIRALGNPLAEFSAGAGTPQARRRFDAQGREIK